MYTSFERTEALFFSWIFIENPKADLPHTEVKIDQPQLSSYVLEAVTHAHTHTHTHTHTHFFAQGREPRAAPPLCGGIVSWRRKKRFVQLVLKNPRNWEQNKKKDQKVVNRRILPLYFCFIDTIFTSSTHTHTHTPFHAHTHTCTHTHAHTHHTGKGKMWLRVLESVHHLRRHNLGWRECWLPSLSVAVTATLDAVWADIPDSLPFPPLYFLLPAQI
jgi:hypothetical protein